MPAKRTTKSNARSLGGRPARPGPPQHVTAASAGYSRTLPAARSHVLELEGHAGKVAAARQALWDALDAQSEAMERAQVDGMTLEKIAAASKMTRQAVTLRLRARRPGARR